VAKHDHVSEFPSSIDVEQREGWLCREERLSGRSEGSETTSLCVDEDSGLIVDATEENAEKFFTADGQLSPTANSILELLRHCERYQIATDLAVAALVDAGLIQPWPLTLVSAINR
jgi:hypothetical protein